MEKFVPINLSDDESDNSEDRDVEMREAADFEEEPHKLQEATKPYDRLILAVDFGTTFSSIAYARVKAHEDPATLSLRDIKCISGYPDDPLDTLSSGAGPRLDVPTELWYDVPPPRRRGRFPKPPASPEPEENRFDKSGTSSDSDSDDEVRSGIIPSTEVGQNQRDHVYWGFSVREHLQRMDIPEHGTNKISRFKLYLNKVDATEDVSQEVGQTLRKLKSQKMISHDADVFVDYLKRLFEHTKNELIQLGEYAEDTPVEFVLCVPAVWPSKACRTMQAALTAAVKESGLGQTISGSLDGLFIMSEPEAAATCVLAEGRNDIRVNDVIVVVDAGGGTVDVATYSVKNQYPLFLTGLDEEIIAPATALSGGTYVNKQFRLRLKHELAKEEYLFENGQTLDKIVEAKVFEFEKFEKRRADVLSPYYNPFPIDIPYLRPNARKAFTANRIQIDRWMKKVFKESLEQSANLVRQQLEAVKDNRRIVAKVILVGGYGASPSLRTRLTQLLDEERNFIGHRIPLITPDAPATMVVKGAVLRALNKANGPARFSSCSYGFLIDELYQPDKIDAHKNVRPRKNETDGKRYINNSIFWLIQKNEEILRHDSRKITVTQKLPARSTRLECTQALYISDIEQKSHYRRRHNNNSNSAEYAGQITADMTFLKDEGHIQLHHTTEADGKTRSYWSFDYDVVMHVDGRNLRYEVRWPPIGEDGVEGSNESYISGQVSIAAGFRPGTA